MSSEYSFGLAEKMYHDRLQGILNVSLTPENIDVYADNALEGLVTFVHDICLDYARSRFDNPVFTREFESTAFDYFGLPNIDASLEHIAQVADNTKRIDDYVFNIPQTNKLILPPGDGNVIVGDGRRHWEEKNTVPRLKTVLFLLEESFNIDRDDPEQLCVTKGIVREDMMRKISYVSLIVPSLNKCILICDEEHNASFVFDTRRLEDAGIDPSKLQDFSKQELSGILVSKPFIGKKIIYSHKFVENITSAIMQSDSFIGGTGLDEFKDEYIAENFLVPNAPDDYVSLANLSKNLTINTRVLKKIIDGLEDDLGAVESYRFGPVIAAGYSPKQQELIALKLANMEIFEDAPECYLTVNGIAKQFNISNNVIDRVLQVLSPDIGDVEKWRFKKQVVNGYSPWQQNTIYDQLVSDGSLTQKIQEGYVTTTGIAELYGINRMTVNRVAKQITELLGEVVIAKVGSTPSSVYDAGQVRILHEEFKRRDLFATPPPEGYLSIKGTAEKYGVSAKIIKDALARIRNNEDFGDVSKYIYGPRAFEGYSPSQQEQIRMDLSMQGKLVKKAPEDYKSKQSLAKQLNMNVPTLQKAIDAIDAETMGQVNIFRFKTMNASGYSPRQQKIIIEVAGSFIFGQELIEEGYMSFAELAAETGLNTETIRKAAVKIASEVGPFEVYQEFDNKKIIISPRQKTLLHSYLDEKQLLLPIAPDDYVPISRLPQELGMGIEKIKKTIQELGEELGELKMFRFSGRPKIGYSLQQREIIARFSSQNTK